MYAVTLDVQHKPAVIIGGGQVAYRKITRLLKAGAEITVISPTVCDDIAQLWQEKKITWHKRKFQKTDVLAAFIVIAATNDANVNAEVVTHTSPYQLVNVVNDHTTSTFHTPAIVVRGDLTIAVTTNGASPMLAKQIKDDIEANYPKEYAAYVQFLATVRKKIQKQNMKQVDKKQLLQRIIEEDVRMSKEKQAKILREIEGMDK